MTNLAACCLKCLFQLLMNMLVMQIMISHQSNILDLVYLTDTLGLNMNKQDMPHD